jgi:hypothetical protein
MFIWVLVAHAYNPSYSRGREQEDCGLKLAWAKQLVKAHLEKTQQKNRWWSGSRCRPSVQAPVLQKRKKKCLA